MLTIGRALKPHGVRGEIKVQSFMDSPQSFQGISVVNIKNKKYTVEQIKSGGEFVILKLKDVNTVEEAETFRSQEICVDRKDAPPPSEGTYYISDLIGCEVFAGDSSIGILKEILQNGSADIYCISGQKEIMFPVVNGIVESVDLDKKTITVNKEAFEKVAVYED